MSTTTVTLIRGDGIGDFVKSLSDYRDEGLMRVAALVCLDGLLPLGPEPVLVTDVDAAPLPNGRLRLSFNERLPGGKEPRNFQMELEPKLMQGMMHLLEQALARSQWQDPFAQGAAAEDDPSDAGEISTRKPRYLN